MPCLTTWTIFFAQWRCPCGQCDHQAVFKTITGLLLSRLPRRNFLEPSEPCPRNNLPELASGTYTTTHRNPRKPGGTYLPENSGICLRNLPSGTYTGTLRNLPEPSSRTCSCDLHRHTPELIWAEDPISLRCWGKTAFPLFPATEHTLLGTKLRHSENLAR